MSQISCPNCSKDIDDASQYCSYCGHKLVPDKVEIKAKKPHKRKLPICPNCEKEVAFTSEKCPYCGHKLVPQKEPVEKEIIQCPQCSRNIIITAQRCPYCKFQLRKKTDWEEYEIEKDEVHGKIINVVKVIFAIAVVFFIAYIFSSNHSGNNIHSITTIKSNETSYSNKYIVNADVIFAATNEANFNTMMNCIISGDRQAIGTMVLNGQVKYLYKNDVVYLVTPKFKYYIVRPEGTTEMLYVVGEQLTKQ